MTPEGCKPIEAFRPGDLVLAAPENDPEAPVAPRTVVAAFRSVCALWNLHQGGRIIRTTAGHPIWVEGRAWTPAHAVLPGDRLRTPDGRQGAVDD